MKSPLRSRPKSPQARPRPSFRRRAAVLLLGLLLLAAGGTWAVLKFVVGNRLPGELAGTWVVVEGELEGTTLEFRPDGSLLGRSPSGAGVRVLEGEVAARGRTLSITARDTQTGENLTLVNTIRTLGPRELVLEDEQGTLLRLERVGE
jgi:hypothetical protein